MPKRVNDIRQTEDKSSFLRNHRTNEIRVTDIGQRHWHPRLQIESRYCANQTVEIWRIHLHRNVEIESNALDAVQNAGDSTADYKLHAGTRQSHKHFLKVIFHSQRPSSHFGSDYRLLISDLLTTARIGGNFSPYFQINHGNSKARESRGMKMLGCATNRQSQPRKNRSAQSGIAL